MTEKTYLSIIAGMVNFNRMVKNLKVMFGYWNFEKLESTKYGL